MSEEEREEKEKREERRRNRRERREKKPKKQAFICDICHQRQWMTPEEFDVHKLEHAMSQQEVEEQKNAERARFNTIHELGAGAQNAIDGVARYCDQCSEAEYTAVVQMLDSHITAYQMLDVTRDQLLSGGKEGILAQKVRTVSLRVHPDKNKHPAAGEAFNRVLRARDYLQLNPAYGHVKNWEDILDGRTAQNSGPGEEAMPFPKYDVNHLPAHMAPPQNYGPQPQWRQDADQRTKDEEERARAEKLRKKNEKKWFRKSQNNPPGHPPPGHPPPGHPPPGHPPPGPPMQDGVYNP